MANMQERLETAVSQTETDSGLFHNIVHGSDTQTVPTETGDVPSVAKAIKDMRDLLHGQTSDLVGTAEMAAQTATEKAQISVQKAEEVLNTAQNVQQLLVETQNEQKKAQIWAEGSDTEVEEQGGVHSSKGWSELAKKSVIGAFPITNNGIASAGQTELPFNMEERLIDKDQILAVMVENTLLLPETYTLSFRRKNSHLDESLI